MNSEDFKELYLQRKSQVGKEVYKQISQLLEEAKEIHRQDWERNPSKGGDFGQSWRPVKGKCLESIIEYIITEEVKALGLSVVNGNNLEGAQNLSQELGHVKRNVLIDYGEFGCHLPDVDIIVYHPDTWEVLAVISSKVTLRERIAQTGYWKLKLAADETTKHIKVYLVSPDEDGALEEDSGLPKKPRAIVEVELDGAYLLTEAEMPDSKKIKLFEHFIEDVKEVLV